MRVEAPFEIDGLSSVELKGLVVKLLGEVRARKVIVAEQRDEIARLKGVKGRPDIKPSGMAQATVAKPARPSKTRRRRGKSLSRAIFEDRVVKVVAPAGSRFKG